MISKLIKRSQEPHPHKPMKSSLKLW